MALKHEFSSHTRNVLIDIESHAKLNSDFYSEETSIDNTAHFA